MSRLKRTVVWVENNYGEEIKLTPLVYSKDSEGNQVLIAKIEETRYIASHIVPLLIPENFKGETRDVQVLARKQNIGKFKADELSFNDTTDFTDYFFFVYLLPSVSQKACRKIRRTCQQVCQKLPQARQKINGLFKFFRDSLNKIRSLNPQFYDKIVRYLWIIWEAIIALLSLFAVITSGWAAYSIIGFYALLIAFQVGSERNNAERMVAEKEKDCAARIKKYEEEKEKVKEQSKIEISRSLLNLSILEHHAAHNGKICVFDLMTGSGDADRAIKLAQYLKKCADDLEQQLSTYYDHAVCASFKLADSATTLRTYTRGVNNLSSRKIIGEPPPEKVLSIQGIQHISIFSLISTVALIAVILLNIIRIVLIMTNLNVSDEDGKIILIPPLWCLFDGMSPIIKVIRSLE